MYAPLEVRMDRELLVSICNHAGLNIVRCAKFDTRASNTSTRDAHPDTGHILLTIVQQQHLRALAAPGALDHLTNTAAATAGWRIVPHASPRQAAQVSSPAPSANPFAALAPDEPSSDVQHPAHAAEPATGHDHRPKTLATLNVHGVAGQRADEKLLAIADLMHVYDVGILAVQETHQVEPGAVRFADDEYTFVGEPATAPSGRGRASGGHGFVLHESWRNNCTYLGQRGTGTYSPTWLKVRNVRGTPSLMIACIYLPDSGKRSSDPACLDAALAQLECDALHFSTAGHPLVALGDFNIRVGNCQEAAAQRHAAWAWAPAVGEACNVRHRRDGIKLLETLRRCDLAFLPETELRPELCNASARNPTYSRRSDTGTARSCIDYILASTGSTWETKTISFECAAVAACGSDHAPVLAACLPEPRRRDTAARVPVTKWRLERLRDPSTAENFGATVHASLRRSAAAAASGPQRLADELDTALRSAASVVLGTRCVVPGITQPWMTPQIAASIRQRRRSLVALRSAELNLAKARRPALPTARQRTGALPALVAAVDSARVTCATASHDARLHVRSAKRAYTWKRVCALNTACAHSASSRDTHGLLKSMLAKPQHSPIAELKDPSTGVLHSDQNGILQQFARHFHALGTPTDTGDLHLQSARLAAKTKAQELLEGGDGLATECALDRPVSTGEVQAALRRAQSGKAPGHDGLPVDLLKTAGLAGLEALVCLFNVILDTGALPSQWRQGDIVPSFKKGDPSDCGNYRGITLLPAVDKLFMSVLADRILHHVTMHDQQYGFVRQKGTTEALFNLVVNIEAHCMHKTPLYALFLDVKKAFDRVNHDMLLVRLHDEGITGKTWRVIRAAYKQTASCVKLQGSRSAPFALSLGVAQGCPLSPVLFIVYMHPLLQAASLHPDNGCLPPPCIGHAAVDSAPVQAAARAGQPTQDSTQPLPAPQPNTAGKLVAQCFADDAVAVSDSPGLDEQPGLQNNRAPEPQGSSPPGLQNTIDGFYAHKRSYDWEANIAKSKVVVFGQGADLADAQVPQLRWGHAALPHAKSERYLGLELCSDGSWARHLRKKLSSGRYALARWRPLFRQAAVTCTAKLLALRTHVLPRLTYGLEVVSPRQRPDTQAVGDLDQLVRDCLYEVFGVVEGSDAWRLRRCVRSDVMLLDSGTATITDAIDAAHLRLAAKRLADAPTVHAESVPGTASDAGPPGLTTVLRATLPSDHPWRQCLDAAAARLLPDTPVLPPASLQNLLPSDHRLLHARNSDISAAVHRHRANAVMGVQASPDRPPRSSERLRPHAAGVQQEVCLRPLDGLQNSAGKPAPFCAYPCNVAVAFLALRSGHVLHEASWPQHLVNARDDALLHNVCPCCQVRLSSAPADTASRRWLLVWHLLSHCDTDTESVINLERFANVHIAFLLQAADRCPPSRAGFHAHALKLLDVLTMARIGAPPGLRDVPTIQYFLRFLADPCSLGTLEPDLRRRLFRDVACFLRGEFGRLPPPTLNPCRPLLDSGDEAASDSDGTMCSDSECAASEMRAPGPMRCAAARPIAGTLRVSDTGALSFDLVRGDLQPPPVPPVLRREAEARMGMA
jgi:endonuclease/exonuclease/phosphatase family metal-dependent hydrolase